MANADMRTIVTMAGFHTWRINRTIVMMLPSQSHLSLTVHVGALMAGRPWTRNETLVAFNLYCRTPFGRLHSKNPDIIATARVIGRTPSSLAMKCCNLAAFDPAMRARGISGLSKASRLDEEIWQQFEAEPETVGFESEVAAASARGTQLEFAEDVQWEDVAGLEREALTKVRVNQSFFRSMILTGYGNACCVCTMPIARLLVASHIVPWSVDRQLRMNPRNGICLCVLHDKAFDRGLLSIGGDFKIQIRHEVRDFETNFAVTHSLLAFDGRYIQLPDRWHPDPRFLSLHQQLVDAL